VTQTQQEALPHQALPQCELTASLLWSTAPVYLPMHHGAAHIHRMPHQLPLVAVPLFVLEEFLSTEQEMLTHAVMLVSVAVLM
jgi:hypothetical protein